MILKIIKTSNKSIQKINKSILTSESPNEIIKTTRADDTAQKDDGEKRNCVENKGINFPNCNPLEDTRVDINSENKSETHLSRKMSFFMQKHTSDKIVSEHFCSGCFFFSF